jgi:hypothetical protein
MEQEEERVKMWCGFEVKGYYKWGKGVAIGGIGY